MKHDSYHSWKAPCSVRVATEYIREFRTPRMLVLKYGAPGGYTEGTRCLPGVVWIIFHLCTLGRKIAQGLIVYHGYAGAPRITPDGCPVSTR